MLNIAVDFDGTIAQYSGWQGEDVCGEPYEKTEDFLQRLSMHYHITIFSARASTEKGKQAIIDWLNKYNFTEYVVAVTHEKLYSFVAFVDDRAIPVADGEYDFVLKHLNID